MQYKFTLPLCPSVNQLYGGGSAQKRFPSKKYKEWLLTCPKLPPLNLQKVRLEYTFYFPTKRAADLANREKATTDYLVKQNVIVDDNFEVVPEMLLKFGGIKKNNGYVDIFILTLPK